MQVKELNQSILGLADWSQFLRRSSLVIAAVLLGSALIMAIAANWLSWPRLLRIGLIQATITALVIFAWKLGQQKPKDWASAYSLSSLSISLAAIALGGLLALIGQSYQTGADPWQLFALWAVLLLPWLIATRSLFIILLVLTLTNLTLFLFFEMRLHSQVVALSLIASVNLLALYGSQRLSLAFHDPYLLVRRFSMLLLVISLLSFHLLNWFEPERAVYVEKIISLGLLGGLAWYYLRQQQDLLTGALAYSGIYAITTSWLASALAQSDGAILLVFFVSAALGIGLIIDLRRVWQQRPHAKDKEHEPWFLRLFYVGIQLTISLFFLLVWWLVVGEMNDIIIHAYILIAVVAIVLIPRQKFSLMAQDLPVFLLLSSMVLALVGLKDFSATNHLLMGWFILLNSIVYVLSPQVWLVRFFSAFAATSLGLLWWLGAPQLYAFENTAVVNLLQLSVLLAVVGLAAFTRYKPSYKATFRPLWVAWVLSLLWVVGAPSANLFLYDRASTFIPIINIVIAALVPLVLFALLRKNQPFVMAVGSALILGLLSFVGLLHAPLVNLALLGWIWAYAQQDRTLFWAAAFLLAASLWHHYYALQWLLIHKAVALALGGAVLVLGAWLLTRFVIVAPSKKATFTATPLLALPKRIPIGLWLGLGLIVFISGQDVARKESLLAHGVPVVLELAPVDPRSLMQGDYMALNFTLGQQIQEIIDREDALKAAGASTMLAYMKSSATEKSTLIALKNPANSHVYWIAKAAEHDLADLAVLKMQLNDGVWLPNGVDAWFFPEGEAAQFEQARFGEFKTNAQGKALLEKLM